MDEFKYLFIIDFESTCWEKKFMADWEIIEFSAVFYSLYEGRIEKEFQQFVFPTENPKLSAFCSKLTGITQELVEREGVPIGTCLMLFNKWVKEILQEYGLIFPKMTRDNLHGNVALMSWSNWDFGQCLKQECSRKRIKRQSYFNQWIDLKESFEKFFKYPPRSFRDALDFLAFEFEGQEHCGLHDARNAAKIVNFMYKHKAKFKITSDLLPANKMNFSF
ncbi:ERI1 exoribonuclease 2 [Phlebotomus papatasi]|uniref:ERI1 exoribonuclease 2 n=1 Tax=Phlebotomus papatasi TaxID=29031 RepID=UPI0024842D01|nr:ERI1 exoribonuclease 2 [Phlebotomus papatasi]